MADMHKREIRIHKHRGVHAAGLFGWLKKEWNKAGHTTIGNLVEGGLRIVDIKVDEGILVEQLKHVRCAVIDRDPAAEKADGTLHDRHRQLTCARWLRARAEVLRPVRAAARGMQDEVAAECA